jgi:hypothetical protein
MKKTALLYCIILLTVSLGAFPQARKPLIGIIPFTVEGAGSENPQVEILLDLIKVYIGEVGSNVIFLENPPPALFIEAKETEAKETGAKETEGKEILGGTQGSPEYIISGTIVFDGEDRILKLEVQKQGSDERVLYTSSHKTYSDLALKARSVVAGAFSFGTGAGDVPELPENLTVNRITGTWRGDREIQMVRLERNGTGMAFFSSGTLMHLSYFIGNNTLRVSQRSPNTERLYHPLPYRIARQLSAEAEPMRWELQLYHGGTALRGMRIETGVRYEGDTVLEFLPGTEHPAEWIKYGH